MPLRQTEEQLAEFANALRLIAEEEPLPEPEVASLSVLEAEDLDRFREVWAKLPAAARIRLLRGLRGAADKRLWLDFNAVNRLALDDEDPSVRLAGIQATVEDRSLALLNRLIEVLRHDPHLELRAAAAEDLARFVLLAELSDLDEDASTRLREQLSEVVHDAHEDQHVRSAALAALGYFSDAAMMEQLATAFKTPALRLGAVRGMGRSADPRWTDRLMPVLGSDDPQMRVEAAHALGEIEDERAVTPLIELIDDPEQDVRLAVIDALGRIGTDEAREALVYAAEDPQDAIREAAEAALEAIDEAEMDPLDLTGGLPGA
jgi:HEAT repeat protein